jgi:hypothetical protein
MIEDDGGWNERTLDDEQDDLSDLDEIVRLFERPTRQSQQPAKTPNG